MKYRWYVHLCRSSGLIAILATLQLAACTSEEDFRSGSAPEIPETPVEIPNIGTLIPPARREDGTDLQPGEIGGYRVYYGTAEGDYRRDLDISDVNDLLDALLILDAGTTYHFVITTYDTDGRESLFSQPLMVSL